MTAFLNRFRRFFLVLMLIFGGIYSSAGQAEHEAVSGEKLDVSELIIHHVLDDHVWHFAEGFILHLPIIVYSSEKGLDVFSSAHFYDDHHNLVPYKGYKLDHNNIYLADSGEAVLDLSITKNVAMLFINAVVMLMVFLTVARAYRRNTGKAPKGVQSFFEPVILFVRDEIAKPNIGHHYEKYFPYLLTLFFFILFGNLLGLIPGSGNLTGNIAVTMVLAIITFIVTNVSGNKNYWSHIFWTPGLPLVLRPIIFLVELIGVFTKPISLMVRLFVAITAGHIVLLSLLALIFVFKSYWVGFGSTAIVLFISLIEILVAAIQAYVFTLFSALYIGMATAEHEHH
jgi:F-type H+-transporting ATPase subunit a